MKTRTCSFVVVFAALAALAFAGCASNIKVSTGERTVSSGETVSIENR